MEDNGDSWKDPPPIIVVDIGVVYDPFLPDGYKTNSFWSLENTTPSIEQYVALLSATSIDVRLTLPWENPSITSRWATLLGRNNDVKLVQFIKAQYPISVTLLPILMDVREVQSAKALPSILVTPLPVSMKVREEQQ